MIGKVTRAIVRGVPDTFDRCIQPEGAAAIDVAVARGQHDRYCATLEKLGLDLIRLDADDRFPDCCFVEDPAIVVGGAAIIADMAAPARDGEQAVVAETLALFKHVHRLEPPATMDGGDVFSMGNTTFVGLSDRTNSDAVRRLGEILKPGGRKVVPINVSEVLHLKSACTALDADTLLAATRYAGLSQFSSYNVLVVPRGEEYAANCLSVNGKVIVSGGFPQTKNVIEKSGFEILSLEMTEFRKAGGSLTCLSILF